MIASLPIRIAPCNPKICGRTLQTAQVKIISTLPPSSRIMDEKCRDLLSQALRDALTLFGVDHDEDYVESLISQVDKDGESLIHANDDIILTFNKFHRLI